MNLQRPEPTRIRAAEPDDQGYVVTTWMDSLRSSRAYNTPEGRRPGAHWWHENIATAIDALLERRDVHLLIAHQGHRIVGWLAYTLAGGTPVVHYVYVRNRERQRGIASALIDYARIDPRQPLAYTFTGPASGWLLERLPRAVLITPQEFLR